jgi:sigma-B regulation protein RsbU (phosphoserine phosphatase)
MVLSAVRGAMHALTLSASADVTQTDWVIQQLSSVLHDMTPAHQFMSMLYGVLDVEAMTYTYTNAGHPLPLLIRDGEVETLTSHGMLLGVVESSQYSRSVVELRGGDLLMFYSDGVSEAMSRKRQMFRSDGIVESLPADLSGSAQDLLHSIWSKLESHLCGGQADDRTLMVVKVRD